MYLNKSTGISKEGVAVRNNEPDYFVVCHYRSNFLYLNKTNGILKKVRIPVRNNESDYFENEFRITHV
jgi:hypothetical protein